MVLKKPVLVVAGILLAVGCSTDPNSADDLNSVGQEIYKNTCAACHGIDGKLGAGGAQDLSKSVLSSEEVQNIIVNGRGAMQSQKAIFENDSDIQEVVEYVITLRK
jgi:cytochrome c6